MLYEAHGITKIVIVCGYTDLRRGIEACRRSIQSQIRKYGRTREAAEEAIRICRDRGVLTEYLKEREKEVIDTMIMLFDQEYAVEQFGKSQKAEGRAEGWAEGREDGITDTLVSLVRKGLLTVKDAAEQAGVTEETFRKLMNGEI